MAETRQGTRVGYVAGMTKYGEAVAVDVRKAANNELVLRFDGHGRRPFDPKEEMWTFPPAFCSPADAETIQKVVDWLAHNRFVVRSVETAPQVEASEPRNTRRQRAAG